MGQSYRIVRHGGKKESLELGMRLYSLNASWTSPPCLQEVEIDPITLYVTEDAFKALTHTKLTNRYLI